MAGQVLGSSKSHTDWYVHVMANLDSRQEYTYEGIEKFASQLSQSFETIPPLEDLPLDTLSTLSSDLQKLQDTAEKTRITFHTLLIIGVHVLETLNVDPDCPKAAAAQFDVTFNYLQDADKVACELDSRRARKNDTDKKILALYDGPSAFISCLKQIKILQEQITKLEESCEKPKSAQKSKICVIL